MHTSHGHHGIGKHAHVLQGEAARGARGKMVVVGKREMAVGVGVGARGRDVGGIKDIGIDKVKLVDCQ